MPSGTSTTHSTTGGGCLGFFVALFLSIHANGLTWWLPLHSVLGWIYVAYWVVFRSGWL